MLMSPMAFGCWQLENNIKFTSNNMYRTRFKHVTFPYDRYNTSSLNVVIQFDC